MNFHSMMVHFPIALLVIYSLLELIGFRNVNKYLNWFYIKASFVIIGAITAFPALSTGEMLENVSKYDKNLVHLHESFASASTNFFVVIAVIYLLAFLHINTKTSDFINSCKKIPAEGKRIINKIISYAKLIVNSPLFLFMAIIGIVLLTITGALGGILSSGVGVDPIADFIYHLFF